MQQIAVVALNLEPGKRSPAKRAALAQTLQIERKKFLILRQPQQCHLIPSRLQANLRQPQPVRRVAISQTLQQRREAAAALRIERFKMVGQSLQFAVLGFARGQLQRKPRIECRLAEIRFDHV